MSNNQNHPIAQPTTTTLKHLHPPAPSIITRMSTKIQLPPELPTQMSPPKYPVPPSLNLLYSKIEQECAQATQEERAPATQQECVPATHQERVPATQQECAPATQQEHAPVTQQERIELLLLTNTNHHNPHIQPTVSTIKNRYPPPPPSHPLPPPMTMTRRFQGCFKSVLRVFYGLLIGCSRTSNGFLWCF